MTTLEKLQNHLMDPNRAVNLSSLMFLNPAKRIECKDGFSVSIQASQYTYCEPRQDQGPWTHVELGFPSARQEEFMEYAETPGNPTGTVYGYVPIELVAQVIDTHGGLENL